MASPHFGKLFFDRARVVRFIQRLPLPPSPPSPTPTRRGHSRSAAASSLSTDRWSVRAEVNAATSRGHHGDPVAATFPARVSPPNRLRRSFVVGIRQDRLLPSLRPPPRLARAQFVIRQLVRAKMKSLKKVACQSTKTSLARGSFGKGHWSLAVRSRQRGRFANLPISILDGARCRHRSHFVAAVGLGVACVRWPW